MSIWVTKRVLITVKTYPTPAWKGGEVVCTAGITDEREWIRLFPVPYRLLDGDKKFSKYQWIEASVTKPTTDARPESYHVDIGSIRVLGEVKSANRWEARKAVILPLLSSSMCSLKSVCKAQGFPTLGIFRPKEIRALHIAPTEVAWSEAELARLSQLRLIDAGPIRELEKIPFTFAYEYRCIEPNCKGHKMQCTDWEMSEAYRVYTQKYGNGWESKFRQKFEQEMIERNDTHFYVGTVHGHPGTWIIIGLFYPRKPAS